MTIIQKLLFSITLIFFSTFLIYVIIKYEKKMKNYNIFIYQDRHRYRTDKVDITPEGIKFIDHTGKNVYINGKYIIEKDGN
jgi:hypothetical protein